MLYVTYVYLLCDTIIQAILYIYIYILSLVFTHRNQNCLKNNFITMIKSGKVLKNVLPKKLKYFMY